MENVEELLTRGVSNVIPDKNSLLDKLRLGKFLNVYLGIDPTSTKIHIGHAVPLRKLQTFVDLGHNVTFLIGDFTALIGDTSDKESERPVLTSDQIKENFKTYKNQASKFVDFSKVKVVHNSEWLGKLNFEDIVKLTRYFSVGDFISRELIRERLNSGKHVRLDETLYPVMQGYDSYFMDTDIQIGGADQTFNMQAGRALQKNLRGKDSFVLVTDYLEGTDGRKMSKTWGNAIWIEDTPDEMFGKVMSLHDELIVNYFNLATNVSKEEVSLVEKELKDGANPADLKRKLAFQLVKELHSEIYAHQAREKFNKTFRDKHPDYSEKLEFSSSTTITDLAAGLLGSRSIAKRFINQKAIEVDGKLVSDPSYLLKGGEKVKIGKKIFIRTYKK